MTRRVVEPPGARTGPATPPGWRALCLPAWRFAQATAVQVISTSKRRREGQPPHLREDSADRDIAHGGKRPTSAPDAARGTRRCRWCGVVFTTSARVRPASASTASTLSSAWATAASRCRRRGRGCRRRRLALSGDIDDGQGGADLGALGEAEGLLPGPRGQRGAGRDEAPSRVVSMARREPGAHLPPADRRLTATKAKLTRGLGKAYLTDMRADHPMSSAAPLALTADAVAPGTTGARRCCDPQDHTAHRRPLAAVPDGRRRRRGPLAEPAPDPVRRARSRGFADPGLDQRIKSSSAPGRPPSRGGLVCRVAGSFRTTSAPRCASTTRCDATPCRLRRGRRHGPARRGTRGRHGRPTSRSATRRSRRSRPADGGDPGGRAFTLPVEAGEVLLVGDETALPAIARILEDLSDGPSGGAARDGVDHGRCRRPPTAST